MTRVEARNSEPNARVTKRTVTPNPRVHVLAERPHGAISARLLNDNVWATRWWIAPLGGAVAAVILSLVLAHNVGFPLDDSWIHQDFARTLATTGRFAYLPGRSGAGSTSPVWVVLLLPPQLLFHGQPPLWLLMGWVAMLGCAALGGAGVLAGLSAREVARRANVSANVAIISAVVAGVGVVTEWHLVWAAASGMETVLFAAVVLGLFYLAARDTHPVVLGLMTALAFAIRPEAALAGMLVIGGSLWVAVGGSAVVTHGGASRCIQTLVDWMRRWLLPFGVSCLVGCVPYAAVNLIASGHLLPSTFYAKSSYYATSNYVVGAASDMVGVAVELVGSSPVVLLGLCLSYSRWLLAQSRDRDRRKAAARQPSSEQVNFPLRAVLWGWSVGLVLVYLGRGVATILHARYLMPVLPELIALCAVGATSLLLDQRRRLLGTVTAMLLLGAGVISAVRGAQIYGDNVRFINGTDVAAALWLRQHATPGALVATHDIGAIGYFSGHPVVDIAGLADPAIIPLLHDQTALESYLRQHHAGYVVIYTTWFSSPDVLVRDLSGREVFRSAASDDFVIYRTGW